MVKVSLKSRSVAGLAKNYNIDRLYSDSSDNLYLFARDKSISSKSPEQQRLSGEVEKITMKLAEELGDIPMDEMESLMKEQSRLRRLIGVIDIRKRGEALKVFVGKPEEEMRQGEMLHYFRFLEGEFSERNDPFSFDIESFDFTSDGNYYRLFDNSITRAGLRGKTELYVLSRPPMMNPIPSMRKDFFNPSGEFREVSDVFASDIGNLNQWR